MNFTKMQNLEPVDEKTKSFDSGKRRAFQDDSLFETNGELSFIEDLINIKPYLQSPEPKKQKTCYKPQQAKIMSFGHKMRHTERIFQDSDIDRAQRKSDLNPRKILSLKF